MYECDGFKYREFKDYELVPIPNHTPYLKHLINKDDQQRAQAIIHVSNDIRNYVILNQRIEQQPNICLINFSRKNSGKNSLKEAIYNSDHIWDKHHSVNVVIHNDKGITADFFYYENDIKKQPEPQQNKNKTKFKFIGDYLNFIKSNEKYKYSPIIIIATGTAGRSITFKSTDNEWILTHLFLDMPRSAHGELAIQSLRGNGQYKTDTPPVILFMNELQYTILAKQIDNNSIIIDKVKDKTFDNNNPLPTLEQLGPFEETDRKFTRNDHTKDVKINIEIINTSDYHNHVIMLKLKYNIDVILDTDQITIDKKEFPPGILHFNPNHSKKENSERQKKLRDFILNKVYEQLGSVSYHRTIQLCYSEEQFKTLNLHNCKRNRSKTTHITGLNPTNNNSNHIYIVVYKHQHIHINNDFNPNIITAWHLTDGNISIYNPLENGVVRR